MTSDPRQRNHQFAVTGRFQPFHTDHLWLVLEALGRASHVIIGVTNPDVRSRKAVPTSSHRHLADANPYGYLPRQRMITASLIQAGVSRDRFDVVPFPLDAPEAWSSYIPPGTTQVVRVYSEWEASKADQLEARGYPVLRLQGDPSMRVSGCDVRAAMREGRAWQHLVPEGARQLLQETVDPMRVRAGSS